MSAGVDEVAFDDVIDVMHDEHQSLVIYLRGAGEISFAAALEQSFPKVILLAAASNLEHQTTGALVEFVSATANGSPEVVHFLRNKAIARQYHSLFDWTANNANAFFGLFGTEFKRKMGDLVREDPTFAQSVRDFLDIGNQRNTLVHGNFGSFSFEKTSADVIEQYKSACEFVAVVRERLMPENSA
ncbi:HEPN domain-containing protein [Nocardia xishanensis]|uniref:HEPN domain-containing protein n=1 Tax=Nocardia xishanensis TaxID=238964 RepID=UPI00342FF921